MRSDKPFNAEMFCNKYQSITDDLTSHEVNVIKNFEKIVQEKYPNRVYCAASPAFIFNDETHFMISKIVNDIDEVITGFMEILITTDNKIVCMNYVQTNNAFKRVRFITV